MMSENSIRVLNYLKTTNGDKTAADVAVDLGLSTKSVNAIFTMALQNKGLGVRVPVDDKVKHLALTPEGKSFDPAAAF